MNDLYILTIIPNDCFGLSGGGSPSVIGVWPKNPGGLLCAEDSAHGEYAVVERLPLKLVRSTPRLRFSPGTCS